MVAILLANKKKNSTIQWIKAAGMLFVTNRAYVQNQKKKNGKNTILQWNEINSSSG